MNRHQSLRGFSLIELMITVAIVAILASIATASYRSHIVRTNRSEAKIALLEMQTAQEKYFLQNKQYTSTVSDLNVQDTTPNGNYKLTLESDGSSFTAIATATGSQATDDAACSPMTIDQSGLRTPGTGSDCWK